MLSTGNIAKKKKRGRTPTGAMPVLVRIMPSQIKQLDAWIEGVAAGSGEMVGRPEAIRRLLDVALKRTER